MLSDAPSVKQTQWCRRRAFPLTTGQRWGGGWRVGTCGGVRTMRCAGLCTDRDWCQAYLERYERRDTLTSRALSVRYLNLRLTAGVRVVVMRVGLARAWSPLRTLRSPRRARAPRSACADAAQCVASVCFGLISQYIQGALQTSRSRPSSLPRQRERWRPPAGRTDYTSNERNASASRAIAPSIQRPADMPWTESSTQITTTR